MTQNPRPAGAPSDYLLYPKRGRQYRAPVTKERTGPPPPVSTVVPSRHGSPPRSEPLDPPLSDSQCREMENRLNKLPMIARLGGRFDLTSDPRTVCVCIDQVQDYHLGGLGVAAVNGAAISAITDCAVGAVGIVHFPAVRSGTVNLAINFVRPLFGRTVRAYCWVTRRTNLLLFVEAAVLDSSNRVCATAAGMVAQVLPRASGSPASGSSGGDGGRAGADPITSS